MYLGIASNDGYRLNNINSVECHSAVESRVIWCAKGASVFCVIVDLITVRKKAKEAIPTVCARAKRANQE